MLSPILLTVHNSNSLSPVTIFYTEKKFRHKHGIIDRQTTVMNRTGVELSRNLQLTELTREKSLRCDVSRDYILLAESSNMARVKTKDPPTVQDMSVN